MSCHAAETSWPPLLEIDCGCRVSAINPREFKLTQNEWNYATALSARVGKLFTAPLRAVVSIIKQRDEYSSQWYIFCVVATTVRGVDLEACIQVEKHCFESLTFILLL